MNYMLSNPSYKSYSIGRYTYGNPKIESWKFGSGKLKIGSFCSIARDTTIFLGGEHNTTFITTSPLNDHFGIKVEREFQHVKTKGDVTIGNDVWIGAETFILSGVKIGDGAVIGARSVVAKDIEPYSIVAGNPIREIRKRFDSATIERLLKIKWWDWDDQKIKDNILLLLSPSIEKLEKFLV